MRFKMRSMLILVAVGVLMAAVIPMKVLHSQDNAITLSLVVSKYMKDVFDSTLISDFESANPGIKINLVTDAPSGVPSAAEGIEAHLDAAATFVSAGDVLMVNANAISPASVAAGYYLDLAPLASADGGLNPDDFQHAVWQSFAWDNGTGGGLWGLPVSANVWYVSYDPAALEQAGFTDPPGNWVFDVFADALHKLTVKDADGNITTPALMGLFSGYNDGALVRGMANETFYDGSTRPVTPDIAKARIRTFAEAWSKLADEGLLDVGKGRFTQIPMIVLQQNSLTTQTSAAAAAPAQSEFDANRLNTLLPGGRSGLDVQGFAVSGGTLYPEQAYTLAKFLTTRPEIASYFGSLPARTALFDEVITQYTAEDQEFLRQAMDVAVPVSELRFMDYFQNALKQMKAEQIDAKTALEAQTAQAISDLQAATERKQTVTITVATPAPPLDLAAGEVSIKFGVGEFADPLPTQALWDDVIADFISNDPQVRRVEFETDFTLDRVTTNEDGYDCIYMPINMLSAQSVGSLLSLDPLLAADPTFDKADMVGSTLEQMTIDGKVWGMPIVLAPSVLKYNSEVFKQAGVAVPDSAWTVDQFKDTLNALKLNGGDVPPFYLNPYSNGSPLLMLMAAYGGIPLDFRTSPTTINFTDAANVTAMREVLDLAKQGYIQYPTLGDMTGGSTPDSMSEQTALFDGSLEAGNEQTAVKSVNYPRGTQFAGATYGIGFAAITATSANPEACYRWISTFAKHPELFSGMPARRSLINDPAVEATQGKAMVDTYNAIADQLGDAHTLIIPDPFSADPTIYLLEHWLLEAFDRYVIDGDDLDTALAEAQGYAQEFQACAETLPAYEPYAEEKAKAYYDAFGVCAVKVDPRLSSIYDGKPKG